MARNFLDEDVKPVIRNLTYMDGFRFGFGLFVAWLLGIIIVSGLGFLSARLLRLL